MYNEPEGSEPEICENFTTYENTFDDVIFYEFPKCQSAISLAINGGSPMQKLATTHPNLVLHLNKNFKTALKY